MLTRFGYCFTQPPGSDYPPILDLRYIEAGEERTIEGKGGALTLKPFLVDHGNIPALGYRIGGLAYSPDMNDIPRPKASGCCRTSTSGSSTPCAIRRIRATPASTRRCRGSS